MLNYLRWFAIAGVWYPSAFLGSWFLVAATLYAIGFVGGAGGMAMIGIFSVFALAHSFALASLVATGLFVTGKVPIGPFRLFTAIVGALVALFVLGGVYVDAHLSHASLLGN